ncbi:TetR/AcrR family transcriptional regulator [Streptomyces prunicolor]|uniref:TetR/AcrR family transcriptional regulator n=1 Tax=Streptomyces prunicolor TaxID=67348 RepID=UPI002252D5A3|nr:TetR/AcrR family transcriptional regulator [Streptomyces prunicolor]MCX5236327.1 TetR/AcrR family transcriptional regulator [Streptomyces prunicolor]
MPTQRPPAQNHGEPIWLREAERDAKPKAHPLTRERIVRAAMAVADSEGLDAVSIRRIAGELKARPMSLYAHIASKDDLFELMHDAAAEETLVGDVPSDWREALRVLARSNRAAALRHPWLLATRDTGCPVGPASLRRMDESAAAVRGLDADGAVLRALILAVDTFTLGHVMAELSGGIRRRTTEEADTARRAATTEYVQKQIDAGGLPHLAETGFSELLHNDDPEASFERGLDWLLAGAAGSLTK